MNEKVIWDFLYSKLNNPYGTAGLMGNLYVESKLNPKNLQGSYEKKLNMTDDEYTKAVDDGSYPAFATDKAGYGLAQWTFSSRKEGLLKYALDKGVSIGNLNMQLEYLWKELQSYKTCLNVLKTAKSVREASDIVVDRYEKPADKSESGRQNRTDYGIRFYQQFSNETKVVITVDKVNIRAGNGKEYPILKQVNKGNQFIWIATAENGWHAIQLSKQVGWVSNEFSKKEK